jgi:hypothetical protein
MELITRSQAQHAIEQGDFGSDITGAAEKVAVILTQSWCPQWHAMKNFVADFKGAAVFYLEYDKTDYFDAFRAFKENTWRNDQIPYVRYYAAGKLVAESNAVPEETFRSNRGR